MSVSGSSSPILPSALAGPRPLRQIASWLRDGWWLWRRAPFKLAALMLAGVAAEWLLQETVPWLGVILSKSLVPMLGLGLSFGLARLAGGAELSWSVLWLPFRRAWLGPAFGVSAWIVILIFAVQQAALVAAYGGSAVDALLFGHWRAHPALMTRDLQMLMLAAGLPGTMILWLTGYALFLEHAGAWTAVRRSVTLMMGAWRPVGLLLLVNLAFYAMAVALPWSGALALVFGPWMSAVGYVIWRDLAGAKPSPKV